MIKQNILTTGAVAILLLAAMVISPLQASDVEYSYLEGRFILDAEIDDGPDDGDGFHIGGSALVTNNVFLYGSFETVEFDDFDAELDLIEFGAGYIYPINTQWDANFELGLVNADASAFGQSDDDTGFSLAAGARGMVTPQIEARGKLVYVDNDLLDDSDTFITLAGDYFFQPNFSAGVEIDLAAEYETLSLGLRYYFN